MIKKTRPRSNKGNNAGPGPNVPERRFRDNPDLIKKIKTSWGVVFDLHHLIWFHLAPKVGAFMHRKKNHPG